MLTDEQIINLVTTFLGDISYIARIEIEKTLLENGMESLSSMKSDDQKVKLLLQIYQNLLNGVVDPFDRYFEIPEKLSSIESSVD